MRGQDVHAMADADIDAAIETVRQVLFNLRFLRARGLLADSSRLGAARRDLARLLTVRQERRIWAAYEADREREGA
jgi:ribosomal protein L29